jgi:hypothetical protein
MRGRLHTWASEEKRKETQNKMYPFLIRQGICIYIGHSSLGNTIGPILLICLLALSGE